MTLIGNSVSAPVIDGMIISTTKTGLFDSENKIAESDNKTRKTDKAYEEKKYVK